MGGGGCAAGPRGSTLLRRPAVGVASTAAAVWRTILDRRRSARRCPSDRHGGRRRSWWPAAMVWAVHWATPGRLRRCGEGGLAATRCGACVPHRATRRRESRPRRCTGCRWATTKRRLPVPRCTPWCARWRRRRRHHAARHPSGTRWSRPCARAGTGEATRREWTRARGRGVEPTRLRRPSTARGATGSPRWSPLWSGHGCALPSGTSHSRPAVGALSKLRLCARCAALTPVAVGHGADGDGAGVAVRSGVEARARARTQRQRLAHWRQPAAWGRGRHGHVASFRQRM